ncbi:MAG: GNAT family N-acetyltransferase [Clostridia bacterium]|nr:GNAT family N-acetyltransferase [Clostridia bacterium]
MISFKTGASSEYINDFCRVFGDDEEFVCSVILCANEVFEIYEDNSFLGGLCVLDVSIKSGYSIKNGAYIYGAFICESARGRGLFKQLCEYVFEFYQNEFYDFALTIPASHDLFPLYERLGFKTAIEGCVSILGEACGVILPKEVTIIDFDDDFNLLYFLHIENDMLIKDFDLFKHTVADFEIKYIEFNGARGYALLKDDMIIYASGSFVEYKTSKKGLLLPFGEKICTEGALCDILFEI